MGLEERNVVVFVSSGFRDMEEERTVLLRHVFPKVREHCYEHDIAFSEIDLRMGVTEEESNSGRTVEICLEEVRRSKPFFIGILGERYGWRPQFSQLSITNPDFAKKLEEWCGQDWSATAIEMMYAVLDTEFKENYPYSSFYLRSERLTEYLFKQHCEKNPEITRSDYYCNTSDETQQLKKLKDIIRSGKDYVINEYDFIGDVERGSGFANCAYRNLIQMIEKRFPPSPPTDKETREHNAYSSSRLDGYIENKPLADDIKRFLREGNSVLVYGSAGVGKSSLLASIAKEISKESKVLLHHCGVGRQATASEVVGRICRMLPGADINPAILAEKNPIQLFQNCINAVPRECNIVIVIDALDRCASSKIIGESNPCEEISLGNCLKELSLPRHVRFLVSTTKNGRIEKFKFVEIGNPGRELVREIIEQFNVRYKKFSGGQIGRLVDRLAGESALYVRTVLDEFRLRCETNYSATGQQGFEEKKIEELTKPKELSGLINTILDRIKHDLDECGARSRARKGELFMSFKLLLLGVRIGSELLTGEDLRQICGLTPLQFATIRNLAPHLLLWRGERLTLGHMSYECVIPVNSYYDKSMKEGNQDVQVDDGFVLTNVFIMKAIDFLSRKTAPKPADYFAIRDMLNRLEPEYGLHDAPLSGGFYFDMFRLSEGYRNASFLNQCTSDELFWMMTRTDDFHGDYYDLNEENLRKIKEIVLQAGGNNSSLQNKFMIAESWLERLSEFRNISLKNWEATTEDAQRKLMDDEYADRQKRERRVFFRVMVKFDILPEGARTGGVGLIRRLQLLKDGPDKEVRMRALEISEKKLGPTAMATSCCFNNLATYFFYNNQFEEAKTMFCKALDILHRRPEHNDEAEIVRHNLAINLAQMRHKES